MMKIMKIIININNNGKECGAGVTNTNFSPSVPQTAEAAIPFPFWRGAMRICRVLEIA